MSQMSLWSVAKKKKEVFDLLNNLWYGLEAANKDDVQKFISGLSEKFDVSVLQELVDTELRNRASLEVEAAYKSMSVGHAKKKLGFEKDSDLFAYMHKINKDRAEDSSIVAETPSCHANRRQSGDNIQSWKHDQETSRICFSGATNSAANSNNHNR